MLKGLLNKIFKVANSLIIIQLTFAPMALANNKQMDETAWGSWAEGILGTSQVAASLVSSYMNAQQAGMNSGMYEQYYTSMKPALSLTPIEPVKVSPVFAHCAVLPATAPTLTGNLSCAEAPVQKIKTGYAKAISSLAIENIKQLQNYQVQGHDIYESQGRGCYNKAIKEFNQLLTQREDSIDKKIKFLEEKLDEFKYNSQKDLEEIKKRTAKLTGKPAKYVDKNLKLEDLFISNVNDKNNVCSSIMSKKNFQNAGKNGIKGILNSVQEVANKSGNGVMTADELLDRAKDIGNQIDDLSNKLQKSAADNDDLKASLSDITFTSGVIGRDNVALKQAIDNYNAETSATIKKTKKDYGISAASVSSDQRVAGIIQGVETGNMDIDARLALFEKRAKQECLEKLVKSNFGSAANFAKKFHNPNITKSLRNKVDNPLERSIIDILDFSSSSNSLTIEQVTKKLRAIEMSGGNSTMTAKAEKSLKTGKFKYTASDRLRPSQFIEVLEDNCIQRYENDENADGYTDKEIAQNIKNYATKIEAVRKSAPSAIKTAIRKNLKDCPSDTTTGASANSCSSALDKNSNNFCLRTAMTCASNMNACAQNAQEKIDNIKKEQTAYVNNYNNHVENFKATLLKETKLIDKFIKEQGDMLNAQLREDASFGITAMKFKLGDKKLLAAKDGIQEEFDMEDPEQYLAMAKEQLKAVKDEMIVQRITYVGDIDKSTIDYLGKGKLGKTAQTYVANYNSQIGDWEKMINSCSERMNTVAKSIQEQNKATKKENDQIAQACDELRAFNAAPQCEGLGDLMTNVLQASRLASTGSQSNDQKIKAVSSYTDSIAMQQLGSIQKDCMRQNSSPNSNIRLNGAGGINVHQLCKADNAEAKKIRELFGDPRLNTLCKDYNSLNSKQCPQSEFEEKLGALLKNGKLICDDNSKKTTIVETKNDCDGNGKITYTANEIDQVLKESNKHIYNDLVKQTCSINGRSSETLENLQERIQEYVSAYNEYKASQIDIGEGIRVAACNGGVNGFISGKGGWVDALTDAASELGGVAGALQD